MESFIYYVKFYESIPVSYSDLASSNHKIRLRSDKVLFNSYGHPARPDDLRELIRACKEKGLFNGFSHATGPTSTWEALYHIFKESGWPAIVNLPQEDKRFANGLTSRVTDEQLRITKIADQPGVPTQYHYGEWGNNFHDWSNNKNLFETVIYKDIPESQ